MKFQVPSFNGLKVTVGTESVTHPRTHGRSKSNMSHQLFQSWGINSSFMRQPCVSNAGQLLEGGLSLAALPCLLLNYFYIVLSCNVNKRLSLTKRQWCFLRNYQIS